MTKWDRALTVALLLSAVLSFLLVPAAVGAGGRAAAVEVKAGRQAPRFLSLNKQATVTIPGKGGSCVLQIRPGRARVVKSNCPKRLCVIQGWASGRGRSIICLPHEIVITIGAGSGPAVDAVVR